MLTVRWMCVETKPHPLTNQRIFTKAIYSQLFYFDLVLWICMPLVCAYVGSLVSCWNCWSATTRSLVLRFRSTSKSWSGTSSTLTSTQYSLTAARRSSTSSSTRPARWCDVLCRKCFLARCFADLGSQGIGRVTVTVTELLVICHPSGCTVASSVVIVVVVVVGVCNCSQMRTSKCTCLIFGVSIGLDPS